MGLLWVPTLVSYDRGVPSGTIGERYFETLGDRLVLVFDSRHVLDHLTLSSRGEPGGILLCDIGVFHVVAELDRCDVINLLPY